MEVTEALQKLTVTSQNMMFTATTAKNYAIFEDVSNMLIQKCGRFLETKMKTPEDVFNFLLTSHTTFPDGKTELLMELLRANGKCSNCKSRPCLVGQDILQKHSRLFWNGMVVAKKDPPSDGTCGFPCNQPNQQEETAGLAVMFNLPGQNLKYADVKTAVSLRCITHQAPIHGGHPVSLLHPKRRVDDDDENPPILLPRINARQQKVQRQRVLAGQSDPQQGIPGFVFACGVASQLSWQNIMG